MDAVSHSRSAYGPTYVLSVPKPTHSVRLTVHVAPLDEQQVRVSSLLRSANIVGANQALTIGKPCIHIISLLATINAV